MQNLPDNPQLSQPSDQQKPQMMDSSKPSAQNATLANQAQNAVQGVAGQGPPSLSPKPATQPLPENPSLWQIADALLRRPKELAEFAQRDRRSLLRLCFAASLTLFASLIAFGLVLGFFSGGHQYWQAPLKMLIIVLFSGGLCLPSLYIFSALAGKDVEAGSTVAAMLSILARGSLLLLAFVPVAWLFAVSIESLAFYSAIILIISLISALVGLSFFASAKSGAGSGYLVLWAVVFLLVILQMPTSLRPVIAQAPTFLPDEKRFFLEHWGDILFTGEYEQEMKEKMLEKEQRGEE